MKLKLILICALLALSLSLFACTSKQASLEISCDEFMEGQHFTWEVVSKQIAETLTDVVENG